MVDTFTLEGAKPKPFSCCPRCGSTAFENGRTVGFSQEIFCRECGAGYSVHVLHDGLFLVDEIGAALGPSPMTEAPDRAALEPRPSRN